VSSSCVTVAADASGSDVLAKGGHHVTFDKRYGDNFVCAIDGRPAGGCHATDSTHYWVYYHRPAHASSWQVSTEGAGTYQPANASTEGWVYDNGASTAPRPANVPYSSICRQTATSSPTPTPTRTHASTAKATATAKPKATVAATTVTSPPTPSSSPTSARAVSKPTHTVRAATPLTSPLLSTTPSSAPPTPVAAGEPAPTKHHGLPTGLVAAIGAVVVVGAAAAARSRRSPR
jgi:hypothetical protein